VDWQLSVIACIGLVVGLVVGYLFLLFRCVYARGRLLLKETFSYTLGTIEFAYRDLKFFATAWLRLSRTGFIF
jgi:uncharacterized membrane-anchored protein YhcB (DUF1043 family)